VIFPIVLHAMIWAVSACSVKEDFNGTPLELVALVSLQFYKLITIIIMYIRVHHCIYVEVSDDDDDLETGAIIGIIAAICVVVFILIIFIIAIVVCCHRRIKRRNFV